jgi:hypothetical protein
MFNPAFPFTTELFDSFMAKEVRHFVRSTYPRGIGGTVTQAFLISHYHSTAEATRHFNAIATDCHRYVFDTSDPADAERLKKETGPAINSLSFSQLIHPENEKIATGQFREHTRRWLLNNTHWELKGGISIYPKLYFQLGELYVRIAHKGEEVKMKFEELENA